MKKLFFVVFAIGLHSLCGSIPPVSEVSAMIMNKAIRLVYPSYPFKSPEHLQVTMTKIKDKGIEVIFESSSVDKSALPPYANGHERRAIDLMDAINSGVPFIWAGAGGAGSVEVVDYIERSGYKPPSLSFSRLIGFSDATHLLALWNKWGGVAYHGPDAGLTKDTDIHNIGINTGTDLTEVTRLIKGELRELEYSLDEVDALVDPSVIIEGSITGGNANLLVELKGTSTSISNNGKFVFIEDAEKIEQSDYLLRRLVSLKRQNFFDGTVAVIFGSLLYGSKGFDSNEDKRLINHFVRLLRESNLSVPVFYCKDFGHGSMNRVLPFGTRAKLSKNSISGWSLVAEA